MGGGASFWSDGRKSAGRSDTDAWRTLVSSPCIGDADDSYPFRGGYFMY